MPLDLPFWVLVKLKMCQLLQLQREGAAATAGKRAPSVRVATPSQRVPHFPIDLRNHSLNFASR